VIKVLQIVGTPELAGAQNVMFEVVKSLPDEHYRVYIAHSSEGDSEAFRTMGKSIESVEEIREIKYLQRALSPVRDVLALFNLIKYIREVNPDVIHTHSSKPGALGRIAAKFCCVEVVFHHNHSFAFHIGSKLLTKTVYSLIEWFLAKWTTRFFFVNQEDLSYMSNSLGVSTGFLVHLPNGTPENGLTELPPPQKLDVIGFLGRFAYPKNIELLIEIISASNDKFPHLKFLIAGEGEERSLFSTVELKNVELLGWVEDKVGFFSRVDAVISTSEFEGHPLALIEASSSGRPLLATNVKGNRDVVRDGENGFFFDLTSADSCIEAIEKMMNGSIDEMGNASRELWRAQYTQSDFQNRVRFYYDRSNLENARM